MDNTIFDSILLSIKKALGPGADDDHFDVELCMFINSGFSNLSQIGAGPKDGFKIISSLEVWHDFIGDSSMLENVKEYIFIHTKILFDPPTNAAVLTALNDAKKEAFWRIQEQCDTIL